jgi:hypothetical protein
VEQRDNELWYIRSTLTAVVVGRGSQRAVGMIAIRMPGSRSRLRQRHGHALEVGIRRVGRDDLTPFLYSKGFSKIKLNPTCKI